MTEHKSNNYWKTILEEWERSGISRSEFCTVAERKEKTPPVFALFKPFLLKKAEQVSPTSLIGKAVHHTLGEWEKLIRYVGSAYLTPDNNAAENAIRPFVLGRKNWLFAGSPAGAESSCDIYSLIETAKQNNINPYSYLYHVFEKAPLAETPEDWQALLPWEVGKTTSSPLKTGVGIN